MVPPAHGAAYDDGMPDATGFEVIDGAGHAVHLEQADRVADLIVEFHEQHPDDMPTRLRSDGEHAPRGERHDEQLLRALLAAAAAMLIAPLAHAQPAEPFFARKTVTIYIGYTAGGSYDLYARLIARHLGKHIPGNPSVVAQNMPGAGSMKAANYVYQVAPKDGTALGVIVESAALEQVLGNTAAQYDAAQVHLYRPRRHLEQHLHAVAHLQGADRSRTRRRWRRSSPAPGRARSRRPCRGCSTRSSERSSS